MRGEAGRGAGQGMTCRCRGGGSSCRGRVWGACPPAGAAGAAAAASTRAHGIAHSVAHSHCCAGTRRACGRCRPTATRCGLACCGRGWRAAPTSTSLRWRAAPVRYTDACTDACTACLQGGSCMISLPIACACRGQPGELRGVESRSSTRLLPGRARDRACLLSRLRWPRPRPPHSLRHTQPRLHATLPLAQHKPQARLRRAWAAACAACRPLAAPSPPPRAASSAGRWPSGGRRTASMPASPRTGG